MKKKIIKLFVVFIVFISSVLGQEAYHIGYQKGYEAGYCHDRGVTCIPPMVPSNVIPRNGEKWDSFVDGYNRGLIHGIEKYNAVNSVKTSKHEYVPHVKPNIPIPEFQPFIPDMRFYQKAIEQQKMELQSQRAKEGEKIKLSPDLEAFVNNHLSSESFELRKNFVKLVEQQYASFQHYPDFMKDGIYEAIMYSKNEKTGKFSVYDNCQVVVNDNRVIYVEYDDFLGNPASIYKREYFPKVYYKDFTFYIKQNFEIENGRTKFIFDFINGYKIGAPSEVRKVVFLDHLKKYNIAQDLLINLKQHYSSISNHKKIRDGWNIGYLTNNKDICKRAHVFVEGGKLKTIIDFDGSELDIDLASDIFESKTSFSLKHPPITKNTFFEETNLVWPKVEVYEFYFIELNE
jgi:hypothetical protein